jgi:glycosyltransferase involved in cell wall biosynthesis
MRILHLVAYPLYSGPLPPTLGLATAQRAAGHTVWLTHDRLRGNFNGYEEAATPYVMAADLMPPVALQLSSRATVLQTLRCLRQLRAFCHRAQVDVVHCHMSHDHLLMAYLQLPGVTLVRTVHAARSLRRRLGQRLLLRRSAGLIVRSGAHRRMLAENFSLSPQRMATISAGIDTQRFAPVSCAAQRANARQEFNLPAQALLVGQAALLAGRGQQELLQALERLQRPEVHVVFAGRGEHETALRQQAARSSVGHQVHFTGYVGQARLPQFYQALDAAFVGRLGNDAGGRGVLEAMATALPVVGLTADAALAELLTPQRSYPVTGSSPADIAAALQSLAGDPQAAQGRGAVARHYVVEERSFALEAAATLRFYQVAQALNGPGQRRPALLQSAAPGSEPGTSRTAPCDLSATDHAGMS